MVQMHPCMLYISLCVRALLLWGFRAKLKHMSGSKHLNFILYKTLGFPFLQLHTEHLSVLLDADACALWTADQLMFLPVLQKDRSKYKTALLWWWMLGLDLPSADRSPSSNGLYGSLYTHWTPLGRSSHTCAGNTEESMLLLILLREQFISPSTL